jgi:hypothetical protein
MDDAKYIAAYGHWEKSIPFSKPGAYAEAQEALVTAASPEHSPRVEEMAYMSDQAVCACGWKSDAFFDGANYALRQWREHVMEVIGDD